MAKRNITDKMTLGWLDIRFNHGAIPGQNGDPDFIYIVEPGEVMTTDAFGVGVPNLIYDFETDTVYSVEMDAGPDTTEVGFLEGVAATLEQYKPGEL